MNILNKIKAINKKYKEMNLDRFVSENDKKFDRNKRLFAYICICVVFVFVLIIGVIINKDGIVKLSGVLLFMYFVCAVGIKYVKKLEILDIVAALSYVVVFTIWFINGYSINYSILWILVCPSLVFVVMKQKIALYTNAYIFVLLCVIFYTPLNNIYLNMYDKYFMHVFPILYLVIFIISGIIYIGNDTSEKLSAINNFIDELTGLGNRSFYKHFVKYMQENGLTNKNSIVVSLDVNGLKTVNDDFGHSYGDELLLGAANAIKNGFKKAELIARIGGDEFVVITNESDEEFSSSIKKLEEECSKFTNDKIEQLSISKGYAKSKEHPYINPEKLYNIADKEMYKDKTNYYLENNIERRKN